MCVCISIKTYAHPKTYGKKTYCNKKNAASHLGRKKIKTLILIGSNTK